MNSLNGLSKQEALRHRYAKSGPQISLRLGKNSTFAHAVSRRRNFLCFGESDILFGLEEGVVRLVLA